MASITLVEMGELQNQRAKKVTKDQLLHCKIGGDWDGGRCRAAHKFSHKERLKCLPRGRKFFMMHLREMNPHINLLVHVNHPDRYKHMENRMWSKG